MDLYFTLLITILMIGLQELQVQGIKPANAVEKWFETYLNHFDYWDFTTFKLRYFEYDDYPPDNSKPLIIELGSQETIKDQAIISFPSYKYSKLVTGKLIYLETRFYGRSKPTNYAGSIMKEYYPFINVEQSLEDIAHFITWYKSNNINFNDSRVVVFGCSYGGTLATWMRYKFPHLVNGAYASAPLLKGTIYYSPYHQTFQEMYNRTHGCYESVMNAYRVVHETLSETYGVERYGKAFKDWYCGDVSRMNKEEILYIVRLVISNPNYKPDILKQICKFLKYKVKDISDYEHVVSLIVTYSCEVCANNHVTALLEDRNDVVKKFQMCTEFGHILQPFPSFLDDNDKQGYSSHDLQEYMISCVKTFAVLGKPTKALTFLEFAKERKNRIYGGIDMKVFRNMKNFFIVYGRRDPWKNLGPTIQMSTKTSAIREFESGSRCADYEEILLEPEELSRIKNESMAYLKLFTDEAIFF